MAQLTNDRDTQEHGGKVFPLRVKGGVQLFAGSLAVLAAGLLEPGRAAAGLVAAGRVDDYVDNRGGADGDAVAPVRVGTFKFGNDGTITQADVGQTAYILDDQTLTRTDGGGTRSAAGKIRGVEPSGVWVTIN